jgi:hypothetical protein
MAVSAVPYGVVECGQHENGKIPGFYGIFGGISRMRSCWMAGVGLCRSWELNLSSRSRRGQRWRLP